MNSEEEIQILNYDDNLTKEYKINSEIGITNDNMEIFLEKPNNGKNIVNVKLREDYIIIASVKIKNELELESSNAKDIIINSFSITIIKSNLFKNKTEREKINIIIPMKGEKNISKNNFFNQKYYFYDFITIDDNRNYLIIYIFDQLHIFKIYQKDDLLKYTKIRKKDLVNKAKVLYLGTKIKLNENIIEIALLLKPMTNFTFIPIDISEKNIKLDEKEYQIDKEKYKNILNKFRRSNCGKFIFIDKENNQKYILYKEENKNEIIVKELQLNKIWEKSNGNEYFHLFNIEDKIYIIAEIPQENEKNYIFLGIYYIFLNKENDKFDVKLIQQIKIKNESGIKENINYNMNLSNYFSINLDETLFILHLDQKGSVDMINKFKLNLKSLDIERNYSEKSNEWSLLLYFIKNNIYISKFSDKFEKLGKCKYIINNEIINEKGEKNKINEEFIEKDDEQKKSKKKYNKKYKEKKGKIKDFDIDENQINYKEEDNFETIIKEKIEKIINDRIEFNKKKLEKLKIENGRKYELINEEIIKQKQENEMLEKKFIGIVKKIKKLNEIKNNNNDNEEEINKNINHNKNNNNNNNINYYNNMKNINKTNLMNNPQINNYRNLAQQQAMNQYNLPNPNLYNNIQNNPGIIQFLLQQQQQRNFIKQGKYYLPNNINNNINFQ